MVSGSDIGEEDLIPLAVEEDTDDECDDMSDLGSMCLSRTSSLRSSLARCVSMEVNVPYCHVYVSSPCFVLYCHPCCI